MPYDAPEQESFDDKVRAVLADTMRLPPEFLNFLTQRSNLYPPQLGALIAPSINATGLGNAVKASRYVGATASGHPTSGYFKVGDFAVDQTGDIWICTVAGSPGTWVDVKGSSSSVQSWAYVSGSATTSCTGNATTTLTAAAGHFYTNDSSSFVSGTNGISLHVAGHYWVVMAAGPSAALTAGNVYEIQTNGGGAVANYLGGQPVARIPSSSQADEGIVTVEMLMTVTTADIPTAPVQAQIVNHTGTAVSLALTGLKIVQLDTDQTVLT